MALTLIIQCEAESASIGEKMRNYPTVSTVSGKSLVHVQFPWKEQRKAVEESRRTILARTTAALVAFQQGLTENPEVVTELGTYLPDGSTSLKTLFNESIQTILCNLDASKWDLIEEPFFMQMAITESSNNPPEIKEIEQKLYALYHAGIWLKKASDQLNEASVPDGMNTSNLPWQQQWDECKLELDKSFQAMRKNIDSIKTVFVSARDTIIHSTDDIYLPFEHWLCPVS